MGIKNTKKVGVELEREFFKEVKKIAIVDMEQTWEIFLTQLMKSWLENELKKKEKL